MSSDEIKVPLVDVRPDHWAIVQGTLQKHVPQCEVWAFGSRAKWTAKPYSDLDLAVICDQPLSLAASAALADDFSESDLPWKVDIVDWATTSDSFRSIIARDKVVVQRPKISLMKLEDCMSAIIDYRGKTPQKTNRGVPLVTAKIVKGGRIEEPTEFIAPEDFNTWMTRGLPMPGDVVLTTEAPLGEVAQLDGKQVALAQRIITLRGKQGILDNTYLKFVLQGEFVQHQLRGRASGSTVSGIKQSELRKVTLPVPAFHEQLAIAQVLGALDGKIELNRRTNATLEAMAHLVFKDWFIDFGPVRAKLDGLPPYLAPEIWALFPDEGDEVGLPLGWQAVRLSELIELNPTEKLKKGDDAPYVDMASLPTSGSWSEPPIRRPFGSGMKFRNGDTLMARITPCLENGKSTFMQNLPEGQVGWGSTEFIVMRAKGPVPAEFAYLLARDPVFRASAIRSMTGTSGRQRAQAGVIADYPLLNCPDELWFAFGKVVKPLFEVIKANSEESIALAAERDLLLPKLISGDLRIPNPREFLAEATA
jgi:type I restriction enzyme S subunit